MPLPLAPLLPVVLRLGLVATTTFAVTRWAKGQSHPGRTDQRAEDALDDLGEGVSLHRPLDRSEDRQTNLAGRMRRVVRFRGKSYELDAGLLVRFRFRQRDE